MALSCAIASNAHRRKDDDLSQAQIATWIIVALGIAGVILRPWRLPEALWAVACAIALVAFGLLPVPDAWTGIAKGADVYFFLTGMMLIAELARSEGCSIGSPGLPRRMRAARRRDCLRSSISSALLSPRSYRTTRRRSF